MNTIKQITKAPKKENLLDLLKSALYLIVTVIVLVFKLLWVFAKYTLKLVTLLFRGITALLTKLDKAVA
jgi:hypothetical protein